MIELYKAIWRVTGSRQILLVVLSLGIAGLAAIPLEYQKNIINGLTEASLTHARLLTLCAAMGGFILLSLALKWLLGYRSSLLGEDVIRLIRNRVGALSGDRGTDRKQLGGGTYATMVSAEAEEIGMFTGSAISEPLLQTGTLVVVISYIASTQPVLGLIALSMIVPQAAIVLTLQRRVNALIAKRVRILRGATDKLVARQVDISQLSSAAAVRRAAPASQYQRAGIYTAAFTGSSPASSPSPSPVRPIRTGSQNGSKGSRKATTRPPPPLLEADLLKRSWQFSACRSDPEPTHLPPAKTSDTADF